MNAKALSDSIRTKPGLYPSPVAEATRKDYCVSTKNVSTGKSDELKKEAQLAIAAAGDFRRA
jgi:hypothetical protein